MRGWESNSVADTHHDLGNRDLLATSAAVTWKNEEGYVDHRLCCWPEPFENIHSRVVVAVVFL